MPLTEHQIERYERQLLLPEVGGRGQQALLRATVRIYGTGKAADEVATYLVAGGVGAVLLDASFPEASRQRLEALNPDVRIHFEGASGFEVECGDSNDRFEGATKALSIMMACIGMERSENWTNQTEAWWTV